MTKRKLNAALNKMRKGLQMYSDAERQLDEILMDMFDGTTADLIADDPERQDMLTSFTDGISASADDLVNWGNEFKRSDRET